MQDNTQDIYVPIDRVPQLTACVPAPVRPPFKPHVASKDPG